jgi:hypothetical protein
MVEVRTQQSGRLEDVSPLDLLQSLGIYRRAGHVSFAHAHGRSRLWFEAGEIVDAESGALRGAAAVHRIVAHDRGEFWVEITGDARERTIEGSVSALIFEAARRLDEGQRLRARLPAADAVLGWDSAAGAIEGPTAGHVALRGIVEAGATLEELLERSGLGELETLQWIAARVEAGQLRATGAVRSTGATLVGHGLGDSAWQLGVEPSRPFVPSPSYAGAEGLEEPAGRRRWWIPVSVGAAVAAVATVAIVWSSAGGSNEEQAQASVVMGSALVAVGEAGMPSRARSPGREPDASRERSLAVGASAAEQPASGRDRAAPAVAIAEAGPAAPPTKLGRTAGSRSRSRSEPAPATSPSVPSEPTARPDDALALLAEARRAYAAGKGETAHRLASRSHRLRPTTESAELVVLAACLRGRPDAAAEALRAVPLLRRGSVRSTCKESHGVRIKWMRGDR